LAGTEVGVGVIVGVGDETTLVGIGVKVGTEIVEVGVAVSAGIEIWDCGFKTTFKISFFLAAPTYDGVKIEGISKENTNEITIINPLFFRTFVFIPLIILTIKNPSRTTREGHKSSCSGNKINIVF